MTLYKRLYINGKRINNIMNLSEIDFVCPICKKDWSEFELTRKFWDDVATKSDAFYIDCCKKCLPRAMEILMNNTSKKQFEDIMRIIVEKL